MQLPKGQKELFNNREYFNQPIKLNKELSFNKEGLLSWQKRIYSHQKNLFDAKGKVISQESLFKEYETGSINNLNLLNLTPLSLTFWKWPKSPHQGPAIYLVMDKPINLDSHILLYIGETIAADKRWKGDHDCKGYLQSYSESFQKVNLGTNLSIRFWTDVPTDTKARRKIEKELIHRWLTPFNKETRGVWNTPFTN
ncbi:GIY-YIG nuclease family protein [Prochlorococcus marinus]|uniref:GIY-YIG nuclease family protein n=1 Tax=Prochlorococcus marinus TaxID=1219 RepID=UPI0022B2FF5D|nr:GIY-YIG nuclease family protein [Prochlorococcus marinus]